MTLQIPFRRTLITTQVTRVDHILMSRLHVTDHTNLIRENRSTMFALMGLFHLMPSSMMFQNKFTWKLHPANFTLELGIWTAMKFVHVHGPSAPRGECFRAEGAPEKAVD
jgi:hypothetical protein